MTRIFLNDRFPGWYVRMVEEGREYTFGPYSEVEADAVLARTKAGDLDALWEEIEQASYITIVKQEVQA